MKLQTLSLEDKTSSAESLAGTALIYKTVAFVPNFVF